MLIMQQYIRNLLLPFYAYLGILKKESIAPETGQHIGYTAFPYPICCGKLFSIHHRLRQKNQPPILFLPREDIGGG